MSDPEELRPSHGSNELTAQAAARFAHLAVSLSVRYDEPLRIAHFLDKLLFCLYAEDAFWQQNPFRDPEPGYLARVFDEEESADCEFGTPIVDGDEAAVRWSAQTKLVDGGREDLAGVSLLRFDAEGLVVEHRDFGVEIVHPAAPQDSPRDHAP